MSHGILRGCPSRARVRRGAVGGVGPGRERGMGRIQDWFLGIRRGRIRRRRRRRGTFCWLLEMEMDVGRWEMEGGHCFLFVWRGRGGCLKVEEGEGIDGFGIRDGEWEGRHFG